jgi:hypothetical protein
MGIKRRGQVSTKCALTSALSMAGGGYIGGRVFFLAL